MFKVKDWFTSRNWKRLVQCVFETSRRYSDISKQGKTCFFTVFEACLVCFFEASRRYSDISQHRENLLKKTGLVSRRYSDISNQSKTCFLTVFGVLSAAKRLF